MLNGQHDAGVRQVTLTQTVSTPVTPLHTPSTEVYNPSPSPALDIDAASLDELSLPPVTLNIVSDLHDELAADSNSRLIRTITDNSSLSRTGVDVISTPPSSLLHVPPPIPDTSSGDASTNLASVLHAALASAPTAPLSFPKMFADLRGWLEEQNTCSSAFLANVFSGVYAQFGLTPSDVADA